MTDRYSRSGRTQESWIKFYNSQYNLLRQKLLLVLQTVRNLVRNYLVTSTMKVADPRVEYNRLKTSFCWDHSSVLWSLYHF